MSSDIKKLLGQRIKELRKSRNLTQEQFAEMIDIDQRNLSSIECGINFPTRHFVKIAQVLDIELKELFDFEHLDLSDAEIKTETLRLIESLNSRDLKIVYRLVKSMVI